MALNSGLKESHGWLLQENARLRDEQSRNRVAMLRVCYGFGGPVEAWGPAASAAVPAAPGPAESAWSAANVDALGAENSELCEKINGLQEWNRQLRDEGAHARQELEQLLR